MKKYLLAFLLLGLYLPASPQDRFYGIKGGLSLSNFWGVGSENINDEFRSELGSLDEQNLPRFTVGLFRTRELLTDLIAVQTEILFIRQGKKWESDGETFLVYVDYLQMPWFMKLTLPVLLKPGIYFGPQLSLMLQARVKDIPGELETADFFSGKNASGELFERFVNVVDAGIAAGVDFKIEMGPGNLVFDFRYTMGALNAFNFESADKTRNYAFMFMAGYALNFGY